MSLENALVITTAKHEPPRLWELQCWCLSTINIHYNY